MIKIYFLHILQTLKKKYYNSKIVKYLLVYLNVWYFIRAIFEYNECATLFSKAIRVLPLQMYQISNFALQFLPAFLCFLLLSTQPTPTPLNHNLFSNPLDFFLQMYLWMICKIYIIYSLPHILKSAALGQSRKYLFCFITNSNKNTLVFL